MNKQIDFNNINYTDFIALVNETNRPPGGKHTIRKICINTFINSESKVLEIGSNTGFSSLEIASIARCSVIGIDTSDSCISQASKNAKAYFLNHLVKFKKGNAERLKFNDQQFDLIIAGGAFAWIKDKNKALREAVRVLKPWGFLAVSPMYYRSEPPLDLISKINALLKIEIMPWDKSYWESTFSHPELELYLSIDEQLKSMESSKVLSYVQLITSHLRNKLTASQYDKVLNKGIEYFTLFNDNQKNLNYSIIIYRKRPIPEQPSLF